MTHYMSQCLVKTKFNKIYYKYIINKTYSISCKCKKCSPCDILYVTIKREIRVKKQKRTKD